jgi:hypothetical protein
VHLPGAAFPTKGGWWPGSGAQTTSLEVDGRLVEPGGRLVPKKSGYTLIVPAPKPPKTSILTEREVSYLDVFEVAELLRVSTKYVYEHCEELGGFRVGKVLRFRSDRLPGGIQWVPSGNASK